MANEKPVREKTATGEEGSAEAWPAEETGENEAAWPLREGSAVAEGRAEEQGLGSGAAGQAGDTTGLSRDALADSESVEELVEEGQAFEAGIISGVEDAPDADQGEVRTRQVPEDDVPQEYLDED